MKHVRANNASIRDSKQYGSNLYDCIECEKEINAEE